MPFARETAACVDLAYDAMEGDLRAEIEKAAPDTLPVLQKLLSRLRARREALGEFTRSTSRAA